MGRTAMSTTYKPENPFQKGIADIVHRIIKDEVPDLVDERIVKVTEEAVEKLLAGKLAATVEELIEKATPALVAAELHQMLEGGEDKRGPGGRRHKTADKTAGKRKGSKQGPRKRCSKCKGCMRQTPPNSGKYECRKCDAGE